MNPTETPTRRVLVTGSTDGIGAGIADRLTAAGVAVVRHARNDHRAEQLREASPDVGTVLVGDLASLASTREFARQISASGPFDAVVHNAGWSPPGPERPVTADGIEQTFQVNALSIYALLASTPLPRRVVLVSSDSITRATLDPTDLQHQQDWTPASAYADSKLAATAIAFALARRRPDVVVTAVHPGWVQTKMSAGSAAPLSVEQGADTPAWLAVSEDPEALVSGAFYVDRHRTDLNPQASDEALQDQLLRACAFLTGLTFPSLS